MWVKVAAIGAGVFTLFGCVSGVSASTSVVKAGPSATHPCLDHAVPRHYTHVIWIFMENHSFKTIIGSSQAPFINSMATKCGLATNYHNITHPSLPNYVAATSGVGYQGLARFLTDCDPTGSCLTSARSIFGQGETWRSYEESMPANCRKTNAGEYAVRHNPAAYYTTLKGCGKFDVPFGKLKGDLSRNTLPAFSFITPNLIDDMHDGTVADGNKWLSVNLPTILNSREYRNGSTAVFITWDEGEGGTVTKCATNTTDVGCRVATIVISPSTKAGTRSKTLFNHYSLLGTAEQLLGLRKLNMASKFPTMVKAFHL
ncbi:MAG TPA: alkaline phosphatase family protein [Streptosporangiaceae bacterium]|nr:alkaline phosphatase family protein [Streptosporangiaceae bacterium]